MAKYRLSTEVLALMYGTNVFLVVLFLVRKKFSPCTGYRVEDVEAGNANVVEGEVAEGNLDGKGRLSPVRTTNLG